MGPQPVAEDLLEMGVVPCLDCPGSLLLDPDPDLDPDLDPDPDPNPDPDRFSPAPAPATTQYSSHEAMEHDLGGSPRPPSLPFATCAEQASGSD